MSGGTSGPRITCPGGHLVRGDILSSDKERLAAKERRQTDIGNALQRYDSEVHPSGETLPSSTRMYRVNVVTTLLKAGIPLSKVDCLRELLEENAYSLCDSAHLRSLSFCKKKPLSLNNILVGSL